MAEATPSRFPTLQVPRPDAAAQSRVFDFDHDILSAAEKNEGLQKLLFTGFKKMDSGDMAKTPGDNPKLWAARVLRAAYTYASGDEELAQELMESVDKNASPPETIMKLARLQMEKRIPNADTLLEMAPMLLDMKDSNAGSMKQ